MPVIDSYPNATPGATAEFVYQENGVTKNATPQQIQDALPGFDAKVDSVATIADLRNLAPTAGAAVNVLGYYAVGDGGGGPVRVGSTGYAPGTYVDNGIDIIVPTGGDGSAAWVWTWTGPINVKWGGAKGDGVAEDGTSLNAALVVAKPLGVPVFIPAGTYLTSDQISQEGCNVYGASTEKTIIKATASLAGQLWVMYGYQHPITLRDVTLSSSRTAANETYNQTGLWDRGQVNNSIENVKITGFDNIQFEVGRSSSGDGSYWASYKNLRIRLESGMTASYGVYVHGSGAGINSNDSVYTNVIVSGNGHAVPYFIGGNANIFIAGGAEGSDGSGVTAVYQFDGNENTIIAPYIEYTANKPILATFTSGSSYNRLNDLYSIYAPSGALGAYIQDSGLDNIVTYRGRSGYHHASIEEDWSENLFINSDFALWRSATAPWGFSDTTGASKDTVNITDGAVSSMRMSLSASTIQANCYPETSSGASVFRYPTALFAGKLVYFSAKVKTTIPGAGALKVTVISPSGNQNLASDLSYHTGDGSWQTLSMLSNIKADATQIILSFSSHRAGSTLTGDIYWQTPVLKIRQAKYIDRVSTSAPVITGKTLRVSNQTDGVVGKVTLVGGTATVTNASVTTSSLVLHSANASGGTHGELTVTLANGSFTVNSTSGTDTRTISYLIVNPI